MLNPHHQTGRRRIGPLAAGVILSVLIILIAGLPEHPDALQWRSFVRLPIEWPLLLLLMLVTPRPLRRPFLMVSGLALFLVLFLKLADLGTQAAFQRPFNPYLDGKMLADGWNILSGTLGSFVALVAVVAVLTAFGLLLFLFLRAGLLFCAAPRPARFRLVTALAIIALIGLLAPSSFATPALPAYLTERLALMVRSARDMQHFETTLAAGIGPKRGEGLFSGLKGQDVVLIFFESYGRSAIEDPRYAARTGARLSAVETELGAVGLASASGWVTSPTVGGLSWLAHGTLLSGLWVDSQARHDRLMISGQPSLNRLFAQAGWLSAAVMPAITRDWPEAAYYGYDRILAAGDLGYRGKPFNWVTMPDQFTLAAFERLVRAPAHAAGKKVMAEMALISSHAPWTPVPTLIDWDAVGDGTVFNPQTEGDATPPVVWADPEKVRQHYIATIDYSLQTLGSYIARFGKQTVFVILGDHQPAAIVTGPDASRAVPIHIVTADRDLIARFQAAGFAAGLHPGTAGREWRMDALRQLLIDLFSGNRAS
ncbi:sulfatase [Rhizobium rhizosphaerae]|uniref:Sulfatase n=1 Tax=Xaviernesmea rhizosphaerae TaxID=1672749 RepID=A0A1Q9AKC2_9HYPH|nr:sulfatase [Xaviernesmea rhizosphaerae]OLP55683.1 sulfatase [Xaviernesmea rhizosphaerae]